MLSCLLWNWESLRPPVWILNTLFSLLTLRGKNFKPLQSSYFKVSSLTLASWSYYMLGQLEPFSTMLLLESINSAFSLQSVSNVCVAIARWKNINISLKNSLSLFIVSWLTYLYQLRTLSISWRSIQALLSFPLKNDLLLLLSLYKHSIGLLFCFCR